MLRKVWLLMGCLVLMGGWPLVVQSQDLVPTPDTASPPLQFGMVLVGPRDDGGWSEAHYNGGRYVEANLNAEMRLYENYTGQDADINLGQIVEGWQAEGVRLVFLTSASFQAEAVEVASQFPLMQFVHIAGDAKLTGRAPNNLGNLMGQMEWGKFIDGCAAALMTENGHIGYLGPLINSETRRLASSAYLGAKHCYANFRDSDPQDLDFTVTWVGFWFEIEGVTEDPEALTLEMIDDGADVILSGIDTPSALETVAGLAELDTPVYATAYNSPEICDAYPDICIGSPFFSWGQTYAEIVTEAARNEWAPGWVWLPPTWNSIYEPDETLVGFHPGGALSRGAERNLNTFVDELIDYADNPFVPTSFPLWQGPLFLQDGTLLAEEGELVNVLDVWYLPQLLDGMNGPSFP